MRWRLIACLLLLVSAPAYADNWDGFATFMAEFVIALPWCMLFLSINAGWLICRRAPGKGMGVLAFLTILGPLGVVWVAFHDLHDAGSRRTIAIANCMAAAVALLPLTILATRAWRTGRRASSGPAPDTQAGTDPAPPPSPPDSPRMITTLGWILVAAGAAIGVYVVRLCLVSYLKDRQGWESFEAIFLLGELAAFAAPPTIIGTALLLRDRKAR